MTITVQGADGTTSNLFASNCRWDQVAGRFVMTRGIGDGYCDLTIEPTVPVASVSTKGKDIVVNVADAQRVKTLGDQLREIAEFCQKSFSQIRV